MFALATRCRLPELMDDPELDADAHRQALAGLRRIHAWSGTGPRLWRSIQQLIAQEACRQLAVMDVGCGDGAILRYLWRRARHQGCELQLIGCDFSSRAIELCQTACQRSGVPIGLHQTDVLQQPLPARADVVINSLFLHHFDDVQAAQILAACAAAARRMVIVEDLLRSHLGYLLCWCGVHLLTRSRVVRVDGLLSVRAAFSRSEFRELVRRAGMGNARIGRHWPERLTCIWTPPHPETQAFRTSDGTAPTDDASPSPVNRMPHAE